MTAPDDEEACRRLMIFLCGSEAAAEEMAVAVIAHWGRIANPEQELLIRRCYQAARDDARREGSKHNFPLRTTLLGMVLNKDSTPSMTSEEEKEFDEFMENLYKRLTANSKD